MIISLWYLAVAGSLLLLCSGHPCDGLSEVPQEMVGALCSHLS